MTIPIRIQRQRTRGWRMPPNAVYVGRPSDYGSRYIVGQSIEHVDGKTYRVTDTAMSVHLYREWLDWQMTQGYPPDIEALRGKDLACWCKPGAPCHADVLLEIANK